MLYGVLSGTKHYARTSASLGRTLSRILRIFLSRILRIRVRNIFLRVRIILEAFIESSEATEDQQLPYSAKIHSIMAILILKQIELLFFEKLSLF